MAVLAPQDPGPRPKVETPFPTPEVDVSAYVLAAVDDHLAMMKSVRHQLATCRKIEPGTRWTAAATSVSSARRYAEEMTRALRLTP